MYQIYKITNQKNGMVYIGSSIEVERRWRQHKEASINEKDHHYNYPLMVAFREFGISNFTFEVVDTLPTWEAMIEAEHNWIIRENCVKPNGYNQTDKTDSPMFDPVIAKKMSDTKREKYGKRVCEIDSNKNIINSWESLAEAGENTGLDRFKISNVCNGTRLTTGNRIFRFLDDENQIIEPEVKVNQVQSNRITKSSKKVVKMNDNNEELQIYDSVALAAADNNCDASAISKVCNGKRNKCGGFKWKYQTM
jgi:group I intron endonuclease